MGSPTSLQCGQTSTAPSYGFLTRWAGRSGTTCAPTTVALSAVDPKNPERYLEVRGRLVEWETEGALEFLDRMAKKYRDEDKFPREHAAPLEDRITGVVAPEHCTKMG